MHPSRCTNYHVFRLKLAMHEGGSGTGKQNGRFTMVPKVQKI
jgi:hypothetical protein